MTNQAIKEEYSIDRTSATQYPIADLLQQRWSPLAFSSQLVEPEKLCSVLEAARWAASSYNEQPWSFIIARRCCMKRGCGWQRHGKF